MTTAFLMGVCVGVIAMVAVNIVGSWVLDRYFEERGRD